jgi:hypothetical protein
MAVRLPLCSLFELIPGNIARVDEGTNGWDVMLEGNAIVSAVNLKSGLPFRVKLNRVPFKTSRQQFSLPLQLLFLVNAGAYFSITTKHMQF